MRKNTNYSFLFIALFTLLSFTGFGQANGTTYKTAIGVRAMPPGVTLKHFVQRNQAVEAIVYGPGGGIRLTGLYEFHFGLPGARGLAVYIGPGAHIGSYRRDYDYRNRWNGYSYRHEGVGTYAGIDLVLGLDWKVNRAPLNISFDIQPSFSFGRDRRDFNDYWGGIAVRYAF